MVWSFYFQAGFLLNYTYESEEDQEIDIHTTKLKIFSPFDVLRLLDITAFVEMHDKLYHANFTLLTNQSRFTVGGDMEVRESCIIESGHCDVPTYKIICLWAFSVVWYVTLFIQ